MVKVSRGDLRELDHASAAVARVRRDLEGAEKRVRGYRASLHHAEIQLDNAIRRITAKAAENPGHSRGEE